MEKIAEINHNILVKLPLGFQSMIKSLPFSDFSLLFSGLSLVIIVMILTINIYSQVAKEILLQRYENHQIPAEIFIENSARVNNFKNKRKNNQNKRKNIREIKENIINNGSGREKNDNNEDRKNLILKKSKKKQN